MCFRRRSSDVGRAYDKAMTKAWGMSRATTAQKYEQYETMVKLDDIRRAFRSGRISAKEAAERLDNLSKKI